jgi:hypothetical protein
MRRKAILATFVGLALMSFCGGVLVDLYLSQHSPTEPRAEEGKTYPVVLNKITVYLTKKQLIASHLPGYSFFVCFGLLAYFGVRWRLMQVPAKRPVFNFREVRKKKGDDG